MKYILVYNTSDGLVHQESQKLMDKLIETKGEVEILDINAVLSLSAHLEANEDTMYGFGMPKANDGLLLIEKFIALLPVALGAYPVFLYNTMSEYDYGKIMIELRNKNYMVTAKLSSSDIQKKGEVLASQFTSTMNKFRNEWYVISKKKNGFDYCQMNIPEPISKIVGHKMSKAMSFNDSCVSCSFCLRNGSTISCKEPNQSEACSSANQSI